MAQVIGSIADVISLYSFASSLFFNSPPVHHSNVRVAAALNGGEGPTSGGEGELRQISVYNNNQQILGSNGGGFIGSGGFRDFDISQINDQQAAFVTLYASNDAICIPFASTTWVDGGKRGWVGDWGYLCGISWYHSNYFIDGSGRKPKCTWLDADHTNGIQAGTIVIHFPSFSNVENADFSHNARDYCGYPEFRAYRRNDGTDSIFKHKRSEIEERSNSTKPDRRATRPDTRLVISSEPTHKVIELCESETSRGPDFVSLVEGLYCDMETREVLKLCSSEGEVGTSDCFHIPNNSTIARKVKRDGTTTEKNYKSVINWD